MKLKARLLHLWLRLSGVWSIFWLGCGIGDIYLRSGCHFGKCIVDMEKVRPIVILGSALTALPWVVTAVVVGVLWFLRWTWRRRLARLNP